MRTTIITTTCGDVTLARMDPLSGEPESTTYFVPADGGYVRIRDREQRYPQVCERLAGTGNTLRAPSRAALPAVIRREHRRRMAAEQRALRR